MVQRGIRNPKPRPRFLEPMECRRVSQLPEGEDWVYEIKQDGYRAIAVVDGSAAVLYSMSGQDYSSQFRHIVFALKNLKQGNLVLDGEVVALDERGRASFQELQNRRTSTQPTVYYVFDVLHHDGRDTVDLPLAERKRLLDEIGEHFSDPLRVNPLFRTELTRLVEQVRALGLEGIVAKRSASIYMPGRVSDAWQKHRFNQEGEFVIGGYVAAGSNFSSVIVGGIPRDGALLRQAGGRRFHAEFARAGFRAIAPTRHDEVSVCKLAGGEPLGARTHGRKDEGVCLGEARTALRTGVRGTHKERTPAACSVSKVDQLAISRYLRAGLMRYRRCATRFVGPAIFRLRSRVERRKRGHVRRCNGTNLTHVIGSCA